MYYDACIISKDADFSQFLRLTLLLRLSAVTVVTSDASIPDAARYVVDLDTCPLPPRLDGEVLCTARHGERPRDFPCLWADRPFRPARLLALFGLVDDPRARDLQLLTTHRAVRIGREEIPLSATEYALLTALIEADGAYVSRERLLTEVWKDSGEGVGIVGVYIHYLRRKIEQDGVKRIFSSRGRGYRLGGEADAPTRDR